jgi:Cytochrome P460
MPRGLKGTIRVTSTGTSTAAPTAELDERSPVKRISILLFAAATAAIAIVAMPSTTAGRAGDQTHDQASPVYVVSIPPGYRNWELVSVAHEAGNLNDLRAILGNNIAVKAFREGKLPFPDGAIIARLAWQYLPSAENNKAFGQSQSFVPGPAHYPSIHDQGFKKICRDGRLGIWKFR